MAALPGPSGIVPPAVTDLAMFSLVQAIIFAEAALPVSVAAIAIAMNADFIVSSLAVACRCSTTRNREKSEKFRRNTRPNTRTDGDRVQMTVTDGRQIGPGRNARPDDPFEHRTETSPTRKRSLQARESAE